MPQVSIRTQVLIALLGASILPVVALAAVSYSRISAAQTVTTVALSEDNLQLATDAVSVAIGNLHESSLEFIWQPDLTRYLTAPEDREAIVTRQRVLLYLHNVAAANPHIRSITVLTSRGGVVTTVSAAPGSWDALWPLAAGAEGRLVWLADPETPDSQTPPRLLMARAIRDTTRIGSVIGAVVFALDADEIAAFLSGLTRTSGGTAMLLDAGSGTVLASNDRALVGRPYREPGPQSGSVVRTGYTIEPPGVMVRTHVPSGFFRRGLDALRRVAAVTVGVVVVASVAFAVLISLTISRPLVAIAHKVSAYPHDAEVIDLPGDRKDEIGIVAGALNQMSRRIQDLIHEVYETRLHEREAELRVLQEQINPHFLYNTLHALSTQGELEGAPKTAEMIRAVSQMLRLSLSGGGTLTTVGDEIRHLKLYTYLHTARVGDQVRFVYDVDETVEDTRVVKLVLQPLVENAVRHGIEPTGRPGSVTISVSRSDNAVVYRVIDDGAGLQGRDPFSPERTTGANGSIGLRSVRERIGLYHGSGFGVEVTENESGGCTVTVTQPLTETTCS